MKKFIFVLVAFGCNDPCGFQEAQARRESIKQAKLYECAKQVAKHYHTTFQDAYAECQEIK